MKRKDSFSSSLRNFGQALSGAIAGLSIAFIVAVFPVWGILNGFMSWHTPWQELSFCFLALPIGALAGSQAHWSLRSIRDQLQQLTKQWTKRLPKQFPGRLSGQLPKQVLKQSPEQPSEQLPTQVPKQLPEQLPESLPQQAPQQLRQLSGADENLCSESDATPLSSWSVGRRIDQADTASRPGFSLNTEAALPLTFGKLLFAFLYIAAIALCVRMNLGTIEGSSATIALARTAGLAIVCLAALLSYTGSKKAGAGLLALNCQTVRHPLYCCALIAFAGAPFSFATWLPLCALPGIFVLMKWITASEDRPSLSIPADSSDSPDSDSPASQNSPASDSSASPASPKQVLDSKSVSQPKWSIIPGLY